MTPFKERMNLYRAYRELNPDKNYWDWKASIDNAGKLAQQFRTRTNKPNFVQRLEDPNRQTIPSWEDDTSVATHRLSYATHDDGSAVIYPEVQQIGNELYDFTDPTNRQTRRDAYQSALNRGDVVWVPTEQDAVDFTTQYKNHYPTFSKGSLEVPAMQSGGNTEDYVGQQIDQYALQEAINQKGRELYIADHTDPNTGVVSPFYDKNIDAYGTYLLPELSVRPEYKSARQMERALNAAAANRGRLYYHEAMREIDAGRKVAELAEWTPVGDAIDLTKAGIAAAQGDYQTAGMLAGMMFAPGFIQKPLQTAKRNAQKFFRRRSRRPDVYMHDDFVNTSEFAARESVRKEGIPQFKTRPTFTDKDLRRISRSYSKYMNAMHETILPTPQLVELYNRVDGLSASERMQLYKIIDDDPAYGKFIYDHPNLNPLSQQTVDAFLELQGASLRGVSFPVETSDDLVKVALSHTSDRHRGGDRLNTNGLALYTSNSGEIGDRFSRPIGDARKTRSDIAKLAYDFKIDKRLPIRDQLALARRLILNVDFVPDVEYLDIEHLAKHGYVAKEAQYTNRFGKRLPAYERAYFPTQHTPLNTPVVQIENVSTRIGLDDAKGRWGIGGVDPHEIDDLLFVGANMGHSIGDYIRLMKMLKSNTTQEINTEYIDRLRELEKIFANYREARFDQYRNLYKKFENSTPYKVFDMLDFVRHAKPGYNKTIAEQIVGFGKIGLGLGSGVALSTNLMRSQISDDAEFADSHLFHQIYDDIAADEDSKMFRRAKMMWQVNNTATLDDFLKRYPEYEEVLLKQDNGVVPAMQYGGENKPLQDPTIKTITFPDGSTVQTVLPWANQQGLLNTPVADMFNPANDVYDLVLVSKDATEGNWAGVGAGLALAMVPNTIEKPLRTVGRGIKKRLAKNVDEHVATVLPEPTTTAIAKDIYAKDVHNYYIDDVFPRMIDNQGVHNSWIEYYAKNPDNFLYNVQPNTYFRNKNVSGRYTSVTDEVALNEDFANTIHQKPTLVHENRHRLDSSIELTDLQTDLLRLAYKAQTGTSAADMREMVATNTEIRSIIYDAFDDGSGKLTTEFINNRIDAMPDHDLLDLVENVNVYGNQYSKNLRNQDGTINKKAIQNVRNALKYVPALAAPVMIHNTEDKSN